uniref:Uncharacterized protein n=1 Tax=Chromera velia CCMP2878 TaxID=1169474 RepID=A0A0G4I7S6_9ALVE|eukprot:Cvel_11741.t1-p1 / transcript=Cvel_11741.t1 / gene=Cvel_11741 / organism=Chromera_velia_CCMP2878 / gene_product=hypothetical protein / transcript_product=hypothetical protein / location=Cvel_scaffold746:3007-14416(-) / protein_length=281 / sequence_SO=supercontig / SO=protein_coding / is_pseudo=false
MGVGVGKDCRLQRKRTTSQENLDGGVGELGEKSRSKFCKSCSHKGRRQEKNPSLCSSPASPQVRQPLATIRRATRKLQTLQAVTAPAGPATFPGSGVYRVNKDPSSWFVVPLGVSFRNLCRVAGLVYSEGARMRQVLDQVAVEGGARDLEYEVVSRFSFREFPVALVKGGDGQRLRVLHGRAGPIVGLVGLEGCENVDLLRQRVQHLEQHAPVGIVTGVCVQNVPDDTSTPYGDLRWTPIGFFGLQEIAPEIMEEGPGWESGVDRLSGVGRRVEIQRSASV